MIPYYVFLIGLIILSLCGPYIKDRSIRTFCFSITVLFFILFAGFRRDNPDWQQYVQTFHDIAVGSGEFHDIGFNILTHLSLCVSKEPFIFFLMVAAIAVSLNAISICRYTPYIFVALLLYFCHNYCLKEMIQIRAGLASALCMYSYYYLRNGRVKFFFLIFIVAVSVHLTSSIFFLTYVVWKYVPKKQILYCVLISLAIGSMLPLGSILKTAVGIDDRLDDYIAYGDSGYAQSLGIWTNINTVKCLGIFCFLYYNYDRLSRSNKYFEILFKGYVIGLCWLICFNDFAIIGARMSNILLSSEPILLTYPYILFKHNSRIFYTIALIAIAVLIFITNIAPNKIVPYKFYFL